MLFEIPKMLLLPLLHTTTCQEFQLGNVSFMVVNRELCYGDYFDHVMSWWQHKDDTNVLFLKYEDM